MTMSLQLTNRAGAQATMTTYVKQGSLTLTQYATKRNGVATFTLHGTPAQLKVNSVAVATEFLVNILDAGVDFSGTIKSVTERSFKAGKLELECRAEDYSAIGDYEIVSPVIATGVRTASETDVQRITWLWNTFCVNTTPPSFGHVTQVVAAMPPQDFTGMTITEAMDEICALTGGVWDLVTYLTADYLNYHDGADAGGTASFGLSDTPNGTTTFGYFDYEYSAETTELRNRVVVLGADGRKGLYTDATSITAYGQGFTGVLRNTDLTTTAGMDAAGAVYLTARKNERVEGSLGLWKSGLAVGQDVVITHSPYVSATFRVRSRTVTWVKTTPVFHIQFGSIPATLQETLQRSVLGFAGEVVTPADVVAEVVTRGGTAFPTAPATNQLFYRTDLGEEFRWDGTNWLCTTLHALSLPLNLALPISADGEPGYAAVPFSPVSGNVWIERVTHGCYVDTTNNGTNYWTIYAYGVVGGLMGSSINTSAKSANAWFPLSRDVGALGSASETLWYVRVNKTLSPGAIWITSTFLYRHTAT